MPHRDPETGQFLPSGAIEQFEDIEVVTFTGGAGIQAGDLGGGASFTGGERERFEGVLLLDYDEIVDRNERLVLLSAHHALSVYANSTETADGWVTAHVEVSASPSQVMFNIVTADAANQTDNAAVFANNSLDDSIDLVGRPLFGAAGAPMSDGASGVGGGGSAGEDRTSLVNPPRAMAEFHPRDELFLNGDFRVWNIDDAGVHLNLYGQHVYGVEGD